MVNRLFKFSLNNYKKTTINTCRDINDSVIKDLKIHKQKTIVSGEISKEDIENYSKTISFDIFKVLRSIFKAGSVPNSRRDPKDWGKEIFNIYHKNEVHKFNDIVKITGIFNLIKRLKEKGYRIGYFTKVRIDSEIKSYKLTGEFENVRLYGTIDDNYILKITDELDRFKKYESTMNYLYYLSEYNEESAKEYLLNIIKANFLIFPFYDETLSILLPDSMDIAIGKPHCKLIIDTDCVCYNLDNNLENEIIETLLFKQRENVDYICYNKSEHLKSVVIDENYINDEKYKNEFDSIDYCKTTSLLKFLKNKFFDNDYNKNKYLKIEKDEYLKFKNEYNKLKFSINQYLKENEEFLIFKRYSESKETFECKNIGVNFDGVIYLHDSNFKKSEVLEYEPNYSLIKFLQNLSKNSKIKITIFTMRAYDDKYKKQVEEYLNKYDIPYDEISYLFNNFEFFIDDKCLRIDEKIFERYYYLEEMMKKDIENIIEKIENFKPWYKTNDSIK